MRPRPVPRLSEREAREIEQADARRRFIEKLMRPGR